METIKKIITKIKKSKAVESSCAFQYIRLRMPKNKWETTSYAEIQASGYFDSAWYRHAYAKEIQYPADPLLDYLRAGISQGRDPSPYFNTILYRRDQDVPAQEALLHFLRSGCDSAGGAYRSEAALLSAQKAFIDRTETRLVADRRATSKPFAVFLQCGAGSLWGNWQPDKSQSWHMLINHYHPAFAGKIPCDVEFHQKGALPGTKFTAIYNLLAKNPQVLEPYEYIYLLDDDIVIGQDDLERLFSTIRQHGWQLAQPSLSEDSFCSYQVFYNPGRAGWRQVNGVEIMNPVISRQYFPITRELLAHSISGWGFDAALSMVAAERRSKAAVVDDAIAHHTKLINADIGGYYQMLHQAGIYPEIEFTHLQKKYGFTKPLFHEVPASR